MEPPAVALDAAASALRSQGFCVLRNVVSAEHLEALESKMQADLPLLMAAHERKWTWPAWQWRYGHHQQDPPRGSQFVFGDVLANASVARVARAVLDENCWVTGLTGNTNLSGSRWQPVHRDRDHTSAPHECIVCNIPTRGVSSHNGAISLWPASHLERETTDIVESVVAGNAVHMLTGALSAEQLRGTVHPAIVERRREFAPPMQVDLSQGDILMRDAKLWHCGTTNCSPRPRFMLAVVITRDAAPTHVCAAPPTFAVGHGCEHEIDPDSQVLNIGPSVEFLPDSEVEADVVNRFIARDRSHAFDGSGPLPVEEGGVPRL